MMYNQPSGHSGVMDLYCTSAANAQFCGVICQQQTTLVSITLQLLCHFLVFICVPKLFFFSLARLKIRTLIYLKPCFLSIFRMFYTALIVLLLSSLKTGSGMCQLVHVSFSSIYIVSRQNMRVCVYLILVVW